MHFFFELNNYLERGLQYGLLRHDHTPRPGYVALAATGHFFANGTILGRVAPTDKTSFLSESLVAEAYVMRSQPAAAPGVSGFRDVLVVFCAGDRRSMPLNTSCALPSPLFTPGVQRVATVYDMFGRRLPEIPDRAGSACIFIVLPVGTVGTLIHVDPPPTRSARTRDRSRPARPTPSQVVLQGTFSYAKNQLARNRDSHLLKGLGQATSFYVYNFGHSAVSGAVRVTSAGNASVQPTNDWEGVMVPPGGRVRLDAHVTPPGGRDAMSTNPHTGLVTLKGDFSESADTQAPVLAFRVAADPSTLAPEHKRACAGSASPQAWTHNVPPGAHINITAVQERGETHCVRFATAFGPSVVDAWSYPQLAVANASGSVPWVADGLRFTLMGLEATPGAAVEEVEGYNVIFFDGSGSQFMVQTRTNISEGPRPQQLTVLLGDAVWNHNGPAPSRPSQSISAADVTHIGIGLNAKVNDIVTAMTVCDLNWIRF